MQFFHGVTTSEVSRELDEFKERIIEAEGDEFSFFNKQNLKKSGFLQEFGVIKQRLEVVQQVEAGPTGVTPYWCRKFVDKNNWVGKNFSYSMNSKELVVAIRDALQSLPGCRIMVNSKGYDSIGQVITVFIQEVSFPMFLTNERSKLLQYAERFLGEENELPFSPYYKGQLTTRGFRLIEQVDQLVKSFNYRAKSIKKSENYSLRESLFHYTITIGALRSGQPAILVPMEVNPETLRDFDWVVLKEGNQWSVKPQSNLSPKELMRLTEPIKHLGVAGYEASSRSFVFNKDPRMELSRAKYAVTAPNRSFIGIEEDQIESSFRFCSNLDELSSQFYQKVFSIVSPSLETLGAEEINSEPVVLSQSQNEELTAIVGEFIVLSELYWVREVVESEPLRDFDQSYYNCLEFINGVLERFNLRRLSNFNLSSDTVKLALVVFVRNVFPGVLLEFKSVMDSSITEELDWHQFSISIMSSPQEVVFNPDEHNKESLLEPLREVINKKKVLPTDSIRFSSYGFKLVKSLALLFSSFISVRFGSPYVSSLASVKIVLGNEELRFIKTSGYDFSNIVYGDEHESVPKYEEVFETTKKALWDDSHHSRGSSEVTVLRASGLQFKVKAVANDTGKNVWLVQPIVDESFTAFDVLLESFKPYGCSHYNESVHSFVFTRNPAEFLNESFKWQSVSNKAERSLGEGEVPEHLFSEEADRVSRMILKGTRFKGLGDFSTGNPLDKTSVEEEKALSKDAQMIARFEGVTESLGEFSHNSEYDNEEWDVGETSLFS